MNQGWEDGVHVQTCGHHLHLDCLKSYLQTLRNQQRQVTLAVERGEYLCPLCRQLANSVLPLSPQLGECAAVVRSRHASPEIILSELNNFLNDIQRTPVRNCLFDLTNCTKVRKFTIFFITGHIKLIRSDGESHGGHDRRYVLEV